MEYHSNSFPFVAGQRTDRLFGSSHVLSPLPIKTLLPKAGRCDQLVAKTVQYIDIGGAGGMIFQTQLMWMMALIGFASFFWVYIALDGFSGIYHSFFKDIVIDGRWHKEFSAGSFFGALWLTFAPLGGLLFINYRVLVSARKMLSQTLPYRFHRQRREVLFSRWNEESKTIETRIVPWEKVCAMVGQSSTVTAGGVMSSASLMIAANDEETYGEFWSALQIGAIDKFHAASTWEMIRTFMDEGADRICDPAPLTLDGIIEEHCLAHGIKKEDFSNATRFWWYINGTMLGIWRTNYEMSKIKQRSDCFADVVAWSKPLPKEQWQKPSRALDYVNEMLARHEYAKGQTIFSIGDTCSRYMQPPQEKRA
ncbi:hypothetical protein [Vibrio furnissii]|uniref:hypothetical protein n=1 Tax=Vibrio furnissii TaxID=29494 RepID=UPI001E3FE205|nr:hypothetical protein [Vibrio furnissii]UHJ62710.1 hypothetical protein LUM42_24215 [Vibrio furnissii]